MASSLLKRGERDLKLQRRLSWGSTAGSPRREQTAPVVPILVQFDAARPRPVVCF